MAVERIQYNHEIRSGEAVREPGNDTGKEFKLDPALLAWLALFGLGGGLLSMYYASIGYLPQIQWEESLVYLGLMTILGSCFLFLYTTLLYIPGRIWCKFILCDHLLMSVFEDGTGTGLCLRSVLRYVAMPFTIYMVYAHLLLAGAVFLGLYRDFYGVLVAASVLGLVLSAWLFDHEIKKAAPVVADRHFFKLAGFFFLAGLSSSVALWIIYRIDAPLSGTSGTLLLALTCTAVVVCVNVFVAITHHGEPRTARWIAVIGAFVLLVCGDLLIPPPADRLSARSLSAYGVGYHHAVTLIVDEKACQVLNQYGYKLQCTKDAPIKVEGVEILSRLGSEYFLHMKERKLKLALPKEDVLAWSTFDP